MHEETVEKRLVHFLDSKLGWPAAFFLLIMTVIGASHMRQKKFQKMIIQNATFCCMILSLLAILVKVKRISRAKK